MIVLAIETSMGQGSLALSRADDGVDTVDLGPEWKSASLHGRIAELLTRNGLTVPEVEGYAVARGPGAFTGVRIGLTTVKGLAEARGRRVAALSTLEVVAGAAVRMLPEGFEGQVMPVLDARRGQVFGGAYRVAGAVREKEAEETVGSLGDLLQRMRSGGAADQGGAAVFCGPEIGRFAGQIETGGWSGAQMVETPAALATALLELGLQKLEQGAGIDAAEVDANYVRPSDAELFWKQS